MKTRKCLNDLVKDKKRLKLRVVLGSLAIIGSVVFLFIYTYFGVGYVFSAYSSFRSLPDTNRAQTVSVLSFQGLPNTHVNGLVAHIGSGNNFHGIWIWNLNGLKYFTGDKNTIFSNFSICEGNKWSQSSAKIAKNANISYAEWLKKTRQGDYVQISLTTYGKIKEVSQYDWWAFQPEPASYFEETCKGR